MSFQVVHLHAQEAPLSGEAYFTRFSGTKTQAGRTVIDVNGVVGRMIDIRAPGRQPAGALWVNPLQRLSVTAGEIGQVFGIAFDGKKPANIYLTATSAFGLHRSPDNANWMAGMWGRGDPGTVWKLSADNNYQPEIFKQITTDGRANTGAALGNIAFDRWNRQFYVSDLESGMIHRLNLDDGVELGRYDHGTEGRASFFDSAIKAQRSMAPIAFDPASRARIADCGAGSFAQHPSCWNFADFRRRVWGLGVRRDHRTNEVRLYYSVWSSQGFGDPAWFTAGDDRYNSVWSVRIAADGNFDPSDVRREFRLPDFFTDPAQVASLGASHPVSDIAFPKSEDQSLMLVAERGGVRNLGLDVAAPFARPNESRVLRYELDAAGVWQPTGRYDIGFYDRKLDGQPYLRANAAGGVDFGFGYSSAGWADQAQPDRFVWATGDLCAPDAPCTGSAAEQYAHGVQGTGISRIDEIMPSSALEPYPTQGYATPAMTPGASFMIDAPIDANAGLPVAARMARNGATKVGSVKVFAPSLPAIAMPGRITATPVPAPDAAPGREEPDGLVPGDSAVSPQATIPPVASAPTGAGEWGGPGATSEAPTGTGQWGGPGAAPGASPPGVGAWGGPGAVHSLTIEKGAPYAGQAAALGSGALQVCAAMQPCRFGITISNVGNAKFDGPFRFTDTMPPGWTYAGADPGWTCTTGGVGNSVSCARNLSLEPGQSISLQLKLMPVASVPLSPVQANNCAEIDWSYTKKGAERGAARSCAPVILAPTAPTMPAVAEQPTMPGDAPDISVHKELVSGCDPGGECTFNVTIRGTQDRPLKDKFKLHDLLPDTWTFAGGGKLDLWTCRTDQNIWTTCQYDIAKNPGFPADGFTKDKVVLTDIRIRPPKDAPEGEYRNCIAIEFEPPPTGEIRKATKYVCAVFSLAYRSKMTVEKRFDQAVCVPGAPCPFTITIRNAGKGAYNGILHMKDSFAAGPIYQVERIESGDIDCRGVLGHPAGSWTQAQAKEGEFLCVSTAPVEPGATKVISVTGRFDPSTDSISATNCSRLEIARSDPAKLSPGERTTLVKRFLQHKGYTISSGSGFAPQDRLALSRYKQDASYKTSKGAPDTSGDIDDEFLKSVLPSHDDQIFETGESAAELEGIVTDCADIALGQPGLVIEKRGPPASDFGKGGISGSAEAERCAGEHVCRFTIKVSGSSEAPFRDPIIIDDTSSNLWTLKSFKGTGWSCTGATKFTCTHPPANLTKANSVELTLELAPSQAFYQSRGQERYPWIYNCAKVRYKSAAQYSIQRREEYESCYRLRLVGSDRSAVDYDPNGTGSCLPPSCSFYEFTATFRVRGDPRPGGAAGPDYDPTGTGPCLAPNCAQVPATGARATRDMGPLTISITPPSGSSFPEARITKAPASCPAERWTCTKSGSTFVCRVASCALSSGEQVAARIEGKIAPELREPPLVEETRTACSVIEWQEHSVGVDIEQRGGKRTKDACYTTTILARVAAPSRPAAPAPTPPPFVCRGGKVAVGNQCVCPEGTIEVRGRCVRCTGGKVAAENRCVCPSGTTERRGRCIVAPAPKTTPVPQPIPQATPMPQPAPQVVCVGGTIMRTGVCICPRGQIREQTGPNAFRCVPPLQIIPPLPPCTGGKIRVGNECVCPPGTTDIRGQCVRRPASGPMPAKPPKAVEPALPKFQMIPGTIVCPKGTRLIQGRCMPVIQ